MAEPANSEWNGLGDAELYPLTLIEWVDASRLNGSWMDWADIPDPYPHRCVTVGFLVSENEHAKILVPTIGDIGHKDNRHTYGGMMIPKSAILIERKLSACREV